MNMYLDMEQMPTRLIRRNANLKHVSYDTVPKSAYCKLKCEYNRLMHEYEQLMKEYSELESIVEEALDLVDYYQANESDTSFESEYGYRAEATRPIAGVERASVNIDPIGGKFRLGIKFNK